MTPEPQHDSQPAAGRHSAAVGVLEAAIDPIAADMGYELLVVEWVGGGKRRILRIYLDHPDGVSVGDCSKMARIIGDGLDAAEAAAAVGQGDAALAGLLANPYTLEVSSPGVDRPLAKRRHFAAHVGAKVKLKTWEPPVDADPNEKSFHGRIAAVRSDTPEDDQRRGTVVLHDPDRDRTLHIPLPLIRRANLVWEG